MRVLLSWLQDWIDLPESPKEIADVLTKAGIEVDKIEEIEPPFPDVVFEVSLTPNLAHCLSVMGIARELAAFLRRPLRKKPRSFPKLLENDPSLRVTLLAPGGCKRYSALLVENIKLHPSPLHIKQRLERSGIRSVSNIVDITNYVAHDIGQPLHAFDADAVQNHELIVRFAQNGEELLLLDGEQKTLTADVLLIADKKRALAAAGVMGGQDSAVTEASTRVIFESAFFTPPVIRRSKRALGVHTESARRFERGCDPEITVCGLAEVLSHLPSDVRVCGLQDTGYAEKRKKIRCRRSKAASLLGTVVSADEMESTFSAFGFSFAWDGQDTMEVEIPPFRHDLQEEVDLIEEIGKCIGLKQETKSSSLFAPNTMPHDPLYLFEKRIGKTLIAQGLQEVICCDLISPELANMVINHPITQESLVRIINPSSIEQSILRPSMLCGLIDVARRNHNNREFDFSLFEIGHVHFKNGEKYEEPSLFACLLSGKLDPHHFSDKRKECDFFDLKGILESLFSSLALPGMRLERTNLSIMHPGRQAKIFIKDVNIGMIGQLHPSLLRSQEIEKPLYFAECDINELYKLVSQEDTKMKPLMLYPASERDWTCTCSKEISFDTFTKLIESAHIPLLESTELLGIYENERLGTNVHNLTFRFVYREKEKTILQEDVEKAHAELLNKLTKHIQIIG
jgi:phenylalanyl-tRNA synthetase beta chain